MLINPVYQGRGRSSWCKFTRISSTFNLGPGQNGSSFDSFSESKSHSWSQSLTLTSKNSVYSFVFLCELIWSHFISRAWKIHLFCFVSYMGLPLMGIPPFSPYLGTGNSYPLASASLSYDSYNTLCNVTKQPKHGCRSD